MLASPLVLLCLAQLTSSSVIVPQLGSLRLGAAGEQVALTHVAASIDIARQVAVTTLDIGLRNPTGVPRAAELVVPVPRGAVVRGLDFEGRAGEPTARVLAADDARSLYNETVHKTRDPALLEFAGASAVRSSVFPVPAGGTQTLRLVYEEVLAAEGTRIDYVLPRSEALVTSFVPWTIDVRVRADVPISTLYSPSHALALERVSPRELRARIAGDAAREPGALHLAWLLEERGVSATLYAYPAGGKEDGGWFLLLAGLPASPEPRKTRERELVLVLDTSGSMRGEKLEQARAAALQVIDGLDPGEPFGIVTYDSSVDRFSHRPVPRSAASLAAARDWLGALEASGATDLDGGLAEALRQEHRPGTLPLVLLSSDGQPTSGECREAVLRANALARNTSAARIFTFGVGYDVNAPLLDHIASASRGTSTYVQPGEDVERAVSSVWTRLEGPVLCGAILRALPESDALAAPRVRDLLPATLPDLFRGEQLVVLGRYRGSAPLAFELAGDYLGEQRAFRFEFDLSRASARNAFVPRLWASRRIAELCEAVRQAGAEPGESVARELVDEILVLSTQFGVLCEYTAFLALEGTHLGRRDELRAELEKRLVERAQAIRVGRAAVAQGQNAQSRLTQLTLNRLNRFLRESMQRAAVTRVCQVADRAFFLRRDTWIDARLFGRATAPPPERVVPFGTRRYRELVARLVAEGRGGILALRGDVLLELDGEAVLVARAERVDG